MNAFPKPLSCLIVEDLEDDARLLVRQLKSGGYDVTWERVQTAEAMAAALQRSRWDLVVSDYQMPDFSGPAALEVLRASGLDLPFMIVSGTIGEEIAVEMMRLGAQDYLMKGALKRLVPAVERELREAAVRRAHREAAAAAAASQKLLGDIIDFSSALVYAVDLEGRFLLLNRSVEAALGVPREKAVGRRREDLLSAAVAAAYRANDLRVQQTGIPIVTEETADGPDGGITYLSVKFPLRDSRGDPFGVGGVSTDITERKRSEARLAESELRYRELFESAADALFLISLGTGRILDANRMAVALYGYEKDELLTLRNVDLWAEPEDSTLKMQAAEARPGQLTHIPQRLHRRKDGSVFPVEISARTLVRDGHPVLLADCRDITERKLLEEKFLRAQRLESIGMLAAGIAHDLNNVLAPILVAVPILRMNAKAERDQRILQTMEHSANRGAALVKQILGFVRTTSEAFQVVQVKHLARDIADVIEETFPKSIRFESNIPSDLWTVQGNATQIHQVLLNLCVNARDAMVQGGLLRLAAANVRLDAAAAGRIPGAREGAWLVLEVSDTGPGIPPEVLESIWTPFFTTKSSGKGTGLGLSTVLTIVTRHAGFVELETKVGVGTTFRVYLPSAEKEAAAKRHSAPPLAPPSGHDELILVVDDDFGIRTIVGQVLEESGYRCITCADGVEALETFKRTSEPVALLITDVDMPRLGGVALAKALLELRPELRVLAMSGHSRNASGDSDVPSVLAVAHAFLKKPFENANLLHSVHNLLHPRPQLTRNE